MNTLNKRIWIALIVLVAVRIWLITTPGYPSDLAQFKHWSIIGGVRGFQTMYDPGSLYDYPPLYGYMVTPIGQVYAAMDPGTLEEMLQKNWDFQTPVHSMLIKIPSLVFDCLLAGLLGWLVARHGLWGKRRDGWVAALLFMFSPAVLFLSGYWGMPDSVEMFFVVAALVLILLRRPELGWVSAGLGALMKPVALPFFPLLILATFMRAGFKRSVVAGLTGMATFAAGFLPFVLAGRGKLAIHKVFLDIDAMPFSSVNGHNLWWLLGPWHPANAPWIGSVSPKMIGLALFGLAYAFILWTVWRTDSGRSKTATAELGDQVHWFAGAVAVGYCFFAFSTHMHENHLYPVLPFLILLAGRSKPWAIVAGVAGLSVFLNLLIHDLIIGEEFLQHIGPKAELWNQHMDRPYALIEVVLSNLNALLVIATCIIVLAFVKRGQIYFSLPQREEK